MSQNQYRENLPNVPKRLLNRPVKWGYPVPWFVSLVDGEYDFRVADAAKMKPAIEKKLCWVCGEKLGAVFAFNIGPMCAVNRISAEPPSHRECAEFSATACPFLNQTQSVRREKDLPEDRRDAAGVAVLRQPGAVIVWLTTAYRIMRVPNGILLRVGDPLEATWFAQGRKASRIEATEAFESGLPTLREAAELDPHPDAVSQLEKQIERARMILPSSDLKPKVVFGSLAKRK